jgi:hypothetical protein
MRVKRHCSTLFALAAGLVIALASGTLPAAAASGARAGLYPAPGVYYPNPSVVLPTGSPAVVDTVMATSESLHGFEIIIKVTDLSANPVSLVCSLPGGKTKTARYTHLLYSGINEPAFDSTCNAQPGFHAALESGQSLNTFVAFYNPPPPLGAHVRIKSVYDVNGRQVTFTSRPFDPYGDAAGLKVIAVPPPSAEQVASALETGYELTKNILDMAGLIPIEILDIHLLGPWEICGTNLACLENQLPTPYWPELSTT